MFVKLEWLGYRMVKKTMTICWAVFIQYQRVTVEWTDRRTELVYQYRASAAGCWRAIKMLFFWDTVYFDKLEGFLSVIIWRWKFYDDLLCVECEVKLTVHYHMLPIVLCLLVVICRDLTRKRIIQEQRTAVLRRPWNNRLVLHTPRRRTSHPRSNR